jgi:MFS family permease
MANQHVASGDGRKPAPTSAWAPFRQRWFAAMWSAQFVSNIGSWMQTVGAQWLMLPLTGSATYVALVQTASGVPVVLFAVLAGVAGDLVDRRRLLLVTQGLMLLAAAALGALALAGLVTPWVLLALVFAVGTGSALTAPTWQVLQPELVPPDERQQAISLGSVNQNLARAVGPAIGGLVLAASSAGTDFLINAASFLVVIAVIWRWRSTRPAQTMPREHVGEAIRAGGRYVAASPALRVILVRAFLTAGSLRLAVVALILAFVHISAVVSVALVVGGLAWILALSTLSSLYQLTLPGWVKARGIAFYLVVFQGGNAVGSAVLGVSAEHLGLSPTLLISALALALGPLAGLRYKFQAIPPKDLLPGADWPAPHLANGDKPAGPVLVTVEYHPQDGLEGQMLAELRDARFSRRRTGGSSWRVWQDAADPGRIQERFVVASWEEHLRVRSPRCGDRLFDRRLHLGRAFQVRHVAGAVEQVHGRAGHGLGLPGRDDPVLGSPDHGDRHRAADRRDRCGRVDALRLAVR